MAAKHREAEWNARLLRLNVTGLQAPGVRGLHEEFSSPSALGVKMRPRQLFEWQAGQECQTLNSGLLVSDGAGRLSPLCNGDYVAGCVSVAFMVRRSVLCNEQMLFESF